MSRVTMRPSGWECQLLVPPASRRPARRRPAASIRTSSAFHRVARIFTRSIPELHQISFPATSHDWTAVGRARECHVRPRSVVHSTAAFPVDAGAPESSNLAEGPTKTNPTSSERNLTAFTSRLAPTSALTRLTAHVVPPSVLSRSVLAAPSLLPFQSTRATHAVDRERTDYVDCPL